MNIYAKIGSDLGLGFSIRYCIGDTDIQFEEVDYFFSLSAFFGNFEITGQKDLQSCRRYHSFAPYIDHVTWYIK